MRWWSCPVSVFGCERNNGCLVGLRPLRSLAFDRGEVREAGVAALPAAEDLDVVEDRERQAVPCGPVLMAKVLDLQDDEVAVVRQFVLSTVKEGWHQEVESPNPLWPTGEGAS